MGEILQAVPNLVCDPLSLCTRPIKTNEGIQLLALKNSTEVPFKKGTPNNPEGTLNTLDCAASFYQQLVLNPHAIGCGRVVPYDEDMPISYYHCLVNTVPKVICNVILDAYYDAGATITDIYPLCSRTHTLAEYMTPQLQEHIYYTRHIKSGKARLNKWGLFNKPRLQLEYRVVDGQYEKQVYIDKPNQTGLYAMLNDIYQVQSFLVYALATSHKQFYSSGTDCIKTCETIVMPELPEGIKLEDYTITTYSNDSDNGTAGISIVRNSNYTAGIRILQRRLDRIMEKKKPSYHTQETDAIKETIELWNQLS